MAVNPETIKMTPRILIATAQIPGGDELRLFQRGDDFMIVLDRNELMNSHLLIGGYGMGFTLRAALDVLPPKSRVTVVELVPEIIDWARGPMVVLAAGCLDDRRVDLVTGDVGTVIAAGKSCYDAILLDVDNGPDGLSRAANDGLYSMRGLAVAKAALKPGGVLAVWSAAPDTAFGRRLRDTGFAVEEVSVRARSNGKGPKHVIWFATKT
jgi:spermidine synthase